MLTVPVLVLSSALLLAIMLNLALKPAFSARLTGFAMLLALLGGLIFYSFGYAEATGDLALSVIRTPLAVFRMFVGVNDLAGIENTALVSTRLGLFLFWLVHLVAFFTVASAAMLTLGSALLRRLRMLLSRRGDLTLIYGVSETSLAFAKACRAAGSSAVVFVSEALDAKTVDRIGELGMSVLTGEDAVGSKPSALRALRLGKRRVSVFALDPADDKNLAYALKLREALEKAGVAPENTRLTLPGDDEIIASLVQVSPERYGFGYVNVFDPAELSARALIRLCPPWELVRFSPQGEALDAFDCAVVGFGRHGQTLLKELVKNAQFSGSSFHAAVFSPAYEQECGALTVECPELFRRYDIESYAADGRSRVFFDYLSRRLDSLRLVVLCTGSDRVNAEIAESLLLFFRRHGAEHIRVVRCDRQGVRLQRRVGEPIEQLDIWTPAFLSAEEADRNAILLNAVYDASDRSDWDKWVACDSFSKMSSRASADFAPAFLTISHSDRQALAKGLWKPEGELLERLGETEHLRWCAFHAAMGYVPMSHELFEERALQYRQALDAGVKAPLRPAKDARRRLHACLIPWSELDALSAEEERLTGRRTDYRQVDLNNVLALPKLLAEETNGGKS
ncbi:MAG: hypothetical protein K6G17_05660 [Oscillospiraceae bacterium]|nr:hypothetical protein [Oscillospiraceae bacterium]